MAGEEWALVGPAVQPGPSTAAPREAVPSPTCRALEITDVAVDVPETMQGREGTHYTQSLEIERLIEASAQFQRFSGKGDTSVGSFGEEKDSDGDDVMEEATRSPTHSSNATQQAAASVSPLDNPDAATIEKVRSIVEKELDAELEYKVAEVALVEERLSEVETLLEKLRACTEGGRGRGRRQTYTPEESTQSTRGSKLYVLVDDHFVQLICPSCQKVAFTSQTGFVNHCRMQHGLRFASVEDAVEYCGLPVPDSAVPLEDPVRHSIPILTKRQRSPLKGSTEGNQRKISKSSEGESPGRGEATTPSQVSALKGREEEEKERERGIRQKDSNSSDDRGERALDRSLDVATVVSRFYVTMRVYIGNTSKHIPEALRPPGDMSTHKWMVYVRGPERDPDISHFVQKVRFFLHPSFKPNDVVDVTAPPFRIVRKGWGEFPVRVQLFFTSKRTKPVDYIHQLKLDHKNLGLAVLGLERAVDVELDREFFVSKQRELQNLRVADSVNEVEEARDEEDTKKASNAIVLPVEAMRPEVERRIGQISSESEETQVYIESLLREAQKTYALISGSAYSLPYAIAATMEEWNAWNIGKRRSSEWQRAKRVRQKILSDTGIDVATKTILVWYRAHGFAPNPPTTVAVPASDEEEVAAFDPLLGTKPFTMKALNRICFCKFCGAIHAPLEDFMSHQRDCGRRQRATTISSWSPCPAVLAPPSLLNGQQGAAPHPPPLRMESSVVAPVERLSAGMNAKAYHAAHVKFFPFVRQALQPLGLVLDRRPSMKPLTESILLVAMLRFAQELIDATVEICREQDVQNVPESLAHLRVLVPFHLFKAICKGPRFDFLTNAGLLRPARRPQ